MNLFIYKKGRTLCSATKPLLFYFFAHSSLLRKLSSITTGSPPSRCLLLITWPSRTPAGSILGINLEARLRRIKDISIVNQASLDNFHARHRLGIYVHNAGTIVAARVFHVLPGVALAVEYLVLPRELLELQRFISATCLTTFSTRAGWMLKSKPTLSSGMIKL